MTARVSVEVTVVLAVVLVEVDGVGEVTVP